ncbi:MAG: Digeranylgeranylglycerophospholipid reductase [Candidatus Methanogasteraceae archaeon]|nr:MAG: Digeranylgeranylglycerophospholipid reductase [ANME-2 cluster archaeon]
MNLDSHYNVAIVGAGPCGATAARYAAEDASVLLIDKKKVIGVPVQCAGFLPKYDELAELMPDSDLPDTFRYPKSCIYTETKYQRFIAPTGDAKQFDVDANVLDRKRFDLYLSEKAAEAGADLAIGTRVTAIDGRSIEISGLWGSHTITADVIIGADGPSSIVARSAGLSTVEDDPMGVAHAVAYDMTGIEIDEEAIEMHFGRNFVPGGYAWIVPHGKDSANVGMGIRKAMCEPGVSFRDYLHRFIGEHPIASGKLKGGEVTAYIAGIVPVGGARQKTCAENVMIAGDAAGHLIATNGGGIPTAMVAGKIAGETAADAVNGRCAVEDYETRWKREIGMQIATSVYVRKLMDGMMRSDPMMTAVMNMVSPAQMKALQRGQLPDAVKRLLQGMRKRMG